MKRVVVAIVAAATLSGCSFSMESIPLPGGTNVGNDPITIKVQLADALDLVPQSSVKLNDVNVGNVKSVSLERGDQCSPGGPTVTCAVATIVVRKDTKLPSNATAAIQQTSLLGEKFVELIPPAQPSGTLMKSGDVIGWDKTGDNPEVEQVLSALSLVINGGGVAQIQTITTELNKALKGHEGQARDVLTQLNSFVGQLDAKKQVIVNALDALNRISVEANKQTATIDATLAQLPGALTSINSQRQDLVKMLNALNNLGAVGTNVIARSKTQTIAIINNLQPILENLSQTGNHFARAFSTMLTYPFVDASVGTNPQTARTLAMGDYVNLDLNLDLDLSNPPPAPVVPLARTKTPQGTSSPTIKLPIPLSLPSLTIPGLTSSSGGNTCILGICLGGAQRAASTTGVQRYSVSQLTSTFDPALVSWYLSSIGGAQ
ncbi:ABC transporter substrate-binding protein [Nocardioides baekrokdamisoli]|uniref:ABC transporter substrate-binding protein n=1 Tax=Nocardioides baekrokdamisoli TaxID=1804624 RepID=A0A3G9J0G1_9ACTN|nr:MCE family protein [Nocardioides baekrokdamisoli]BBH16954.1 ABC transporter substrate-binding protein [Nocardioides baekrokdamisoli]